MLMGVFGDMESISGVIFAVRSIHHSNIDMLVSYLVMNEAARFSFHWQNSYPKLMKLILKLKVEPDLNLVGYVQNVYLIRKFGIQPSLICRSICPPKSHKIFVVVFPKKGNNS